MRVLAAGLALMAHTFAIGALCLCSSETVAAREKKPGGAAMSCHETAHGVSLSSLEDCCCDTEATERPSGPVVTRTLDEISLSVSLQLSISILIMPVLRVALPSASYRRAVPPRPPLRV